MNKRICLAVLLVAACSDSNPTTPPTDPPAELRVEPAEVDIAALKTSASLRATLGAQTTEMPTLSLVSEKRWVEDAPVLNADSLARGRLFADAPGTAIVRVNAFGKNKDVTVRVAHPNPAILSMRTSASDIGTGDTITLTGYRVDLIAMPISFGATALTVISKDSANLRLLVGAVPPAAICDATIRTDSLIAVGVSRFVTTMRTRRPANALHVARGDVVELNDTQLACMQFAAGTKYALAFADSRLIDLAQLPFHERRLPAGWSVQLRQLSGSASNLAQAHAAAQQTASTTPDWNVSSSAPDPNEPQMRTRPWTLDEEFPVLPLAGLYPVMNARVKRIYDGRYVFAVQSDIAADTVARILEGLDAIFPRVISENIPFMKSVFSNSTPVSSPASQQLLIMLVRGCESASGRAIGRVVEGAPGTYAWILLGSCSMPQSVNFFQPLELLLTHELAHTWQFEYEGEQTGYPLTAAETWGVEGGADVVVQEIFRRRINVGLTDNWPWTAHLGFNGPTGIHARGPAITGSMTTGYLNAASYLLDVVIRRMAAGETYQSALNNVLRSSLKSWHGVSGILSLPNRPGFIADMRSFDPTWDAVYSLARWALSHAVDDMTANTSLQNRTYFNASTAHQTVGWKPMLTMTSAAQADRTLTLTPGNPGYVYFDNSAGPGTYTASASVTGVRWLLVRYQ